MAVANSESRAVILVVDDDPIIRKLALRALDTAGSDAELLEAEDGVAAQRILEERSVDLVVTDLLMPRLDGLGLIRWANEHRPGSAWIVLSGIDSFDNAIEAIHLGAVDFLPKPPHVERLRLVVRNALHQRALEAEQRRLALALSDANLALEGRVVQLEDACRLLEDQARMLDRDLSQAEVIQRALLPSAAPQLDGYRVDTFYRPGHRVGGDLYDVVPIDEHRFAISVADACGHGVSAAMLSVLFKLHMRTNLRQRSSEQVMSGLGPPRHPAELLGVVNRALRNDVPAPGMFVTSACLLLDTRAGTLTLSSAGHPPLLWLRANGEVREIERTGPALGLYADAEFEETVLELERGDRLLLYTDGLLEAGPLEAVGKCLAEGDLADPHALLRSLFERATAHEEERDDITLVLLSAADGEGRFDDVVESKPKKFAACHAAELCWGETSDGTFFAISGRATWTDAADLFDAALGVVERGRALTLDLSDCEYLDSTVLGTLHEIIARAEAVGVAARVQGLSDELLAMFEELDMHAVLEQAVSTPLPAPVDLAPIRRGAREEQQQVRVLHAHETLSSLSAANREQLEQVLTALRAELRPTGE